MIESLGSRGEKLLAANMHADEKVLAKIKGAWGQGLVLTDRHIFVLKWGYMTGNTFGGRCSAFDYSKVVGVEIKKDLLTGVLEILTASTQDAHLSFWNQNARSAFKSNYAVTFNSTMFDKFQKVTVLAREKINSKA